MRSFFWKTIPEEQVRGKTNIWTIAARPQYQIDTKTIEELFGQQEETKPQDTRSRSLKSSFKETKEEVRTEVQSFFSTMLWYESCLAFVYLYLCRGPF